MGILGADQIRRLPDEVVADVIKVMGQVSAQVPNVLGPITPIDTGHMRQSWKGRHNGKFQTTIRNTAYYSDFVENGTSRMKAQPTITPMLPIIEAEIFRAVSTGTDFYLSGGAFPDRANQLKTAYKSKYGNYGSQVGFSG